MPATAPPAHPRLSLVTVAALPLAGWALHTTVLTSRLDRARRDPLTGLPTRDTFTTTATRLTNRSPVLVTLIDLDGFKAVNDTHGHHAGDAILRATAARLREFTQAHGIAARFGGDEFTTATPADLNSPEDGPLTDLSWLHYRLTEPVPHQGGVLRVGASIGGCVALPGTSLGAALGAADTAMYTAKRAGGGWCLAATDTANAPALQRRWRRNRPAPGRAA